MPTVYTIADIGAIVRKKRIELGMTQTQLADISGSGTRFISELENGKQTMQIGKVLNLLHFLGFNISISKRGAEHGA
ncbi:MAG: helix-turn-helix transcriptional regulator [Oscillospiraceae bacterium]|nr:helix-turn-helix transcriptional regulator [Oscillospiraceae bacterium]